MAKLPWVTPTRHAMCHGEQRHHPTNKRFGQGQVRDDLVPSSGRKAVLLSHFILTKRLRSAVIGISSPPYLCTLSTKIVHCTTRGSRRSDMT